VSRIQRWQRRADARARAARRGRSWTTPHARLRVAYNDSYYRREGIPRLNDQAFERIRPSPVGDPLALLREAERRCEVGQ
jgi:hypothetical protein